RLSAAEQLVDHARGPGQAPAVGPALARVVEEDVAAGRDVRMPELPVQARGVLGVVAVDEDEVDRRGPAPGRVLAALDVPDHARAAVAGGARDDAPAGA